MPSIVDFIRDLTDSDLQFLARSLAVALASSVVCAVLGCYVVLRGMAFIGDAVAHAVFPGLAVAFVLQLNLLVSGALAGIITALLVAVFAQHPRLKTDTVIGVFFAFTFGLGIVIISFSPGYTGNLQQLLFGSITSVTAADTLTVFTAATVLLLTAALIHRPLVLVSLDRELARAAGVRVAWIEAVLYAAIAVAVVISVQAIGNVLVLALLITPAATARLLTNRLGKMMIISPLIGVFAALSGVYASWALGIPAGGAIVIVASLIFFSCWLLAPGSGVLLSRWRSLKAGTTGKAAVKAAVVCALAALLAGHSFSPEPATALEEIADPPGKLLPALKSEDSVRVIQNVHTDTVSVFVDNGRLVLAAAADIDGDGDSIVDKAVRVDPQKTVFHLASESAQQLPDSSNFAFLGAPGDTVWLAPQQQDSQLIWPGFSTEHSSVGQALLGGKIELSLIDAQGPGRVEIFQQGIIGAERLFSGAEQLPPWHLEVPQHAHANWAFTEPGVYRLTFEAAAQVAGEQQRARASYVFVVGKLDREPESYLLADGANNADKNPADAATENSDGQPNSAAPQNPGSGDSGAVKNPPDVAELPESAQKPDPQADKKPAAPNPKPQARPAPPVNTAVPQAHSAPPARVPQRAAAQLCAPEVVLDHGHIDMFNVTAAGAAATLQLKEDATGAHVIREPESAVIKIGEHARRELPSGVPGAPSGYVLPYTQQPNLPWPGWDTNATRGSSFTDVTINIAGVTGPGQVHVFAQNSFGATSALLQGGGTQLPGMIHEPRPAHTHAQWVFTAPGVYQLRVKALLRDPQNGRSIETATRVYTVQVGDADLGDALCGIDAAAGIADSDRVAQNAAAGDAAAAEKKPKSAKKSGARVKSAAQVSAPAAKALKDLGIDAATFAALSPEEQQRLLDNLQRSRERRQLWLGAAIGFGFTALLGAIGYVTRKNLKKILR